MQEHPPDGAVRVLIASRAAEAVAELEKLAGHADRVSLVGFVRSASELEEDLDALEPDLVLLHPDFSPVDPAHLVAALATRTPAVRVIVVLGAGAAQLRPGLEGAGAATVSAEADPEQLVRAIQAAAGRLRTGPESEVFRPAPLAWLEVPETEEDVTGAEPADRWTAATAALEEVADPSAPAWEPASRAPDAADGPAAVSETQRAQAIEEAPGEVATGEPLVPLPEEWEAASGADGGKREAAPTVAPAGEPCPTGTAPEPAAPGSPPSTEKAPDQPEAGAGARQPAPAGWPGEDEVEVVVSPEGVPVFHLDTAALEALPALAPAPSPRSESEPIQPVRPRPPQRRSGRADLVVVFAGKGGVGKTTIATNLAVALAAGGSRVALVDLDLQFGDVGVMLHTESHPTAIDALAPQGEQVDGDFIEDVMATGPEGVRALLAPSSPEFADLVNTANLRAILRELAKGYDQVIVDTPAHLEERNLEAIEMADQIIVVSSFTIASIKDTKVTLKLLQSLGIPKERLCVVLNQTRAKTNFSRSEVEENLRFRVVTALPFEPRLDDFIDTGRPFVSADPKSELSKQFRVLVDHILGRAGAAAAAEPERPRARANRRRFSLGRG
jgi:MinD-like ATPase involved in chromosome partitioning or flagellar assembly